MFFILMNSLYEKNLFFINLKLVIIIANILKNVLHVNIVFNVINVENVIFVSIVIIVILVKKLNIV